MSAVDGPGSAAAATERLAGKVAFVTGAARGIGRACALRFAEEGADLVLVDIAAPIETVAYEGARPDQLSSVADEVRALGRRVQISACDVRDGQALRDAAADAVRTFGSIDVALGAAGIDSRAKAWEITDMQWQSVIDINLGGVWQTAKAVAPHMIEQRSGSIVLIGSVLSHKHFPGSAHYTAAKHGVLGLTRAFALELAPSLVRVNAVAPTAVATEMALSQTFVDEPASGADGELEARLLRWNAMPIPMVEPRDVANAALFLASEEARYITGASLPVDLGAMLR